MRSESGQSEAVSLARGRGCNVVIVPDTAYRAAPVRKLVGGEGLAERLG